MSTSRIRGWAGVALAAFGLLLMRAGPGFAVSASAAPGCRDSAACRAINSVEGTVGPNGIQVTSSTASCEGDCNGGGTCAQSSMDNPDGTRSFHCSCDPNSGSDTCSGFATVDKATGECREFLCIGHCDPGNPPIVPPPQCRPVPFDTHVADGCPAPATGKVICDCR